MNQYPNPNSGTVEIKIEENVENFTKWNELDEGKTLLCSICLEELVNEENTILECHGCEIKVHKSCACAFEKHISMREREMQIQSHKSLLQSYNRQKQQFPGSVFPEAQEQNLIIEFVPKSDSNVKRLLSTREDVFPKYNERYFEKAFSKYYKIKDKTKLKDSERTLYLMTKL